jgi:hypothetical protein
MHTPPLPQYPISLPSKIGKHDEFLRSSTISSANPEIMARSVVMVKLGVHNSLVGKYPHMV